MLTGGPTQTTDQVGLSTSGIAFLLGGVGFSVVIGWIGFSFFFFFLGGGVSGSEKIE